MTPIYLHTHPNMERDLGLDAGHVIVDHSAWERASNPVVLSRRNLLSLLHKLIRDGRGSLHKPHGACIDVEPDKVHYAGREPGPMSSDTELFIGLLEGALKRIKHQMENLPTTLSEPEDWPKDPCRNCQPSGDDCLHCTKGM